MSGRGVWVCHCHLGARREGNACGSGTVSTRRRRGGREYEWEGGREDGEGSVGASKAEMRGRGGGSSYYREGRGGGRDGRRSAPLGSVGAPKAEMRRRGGGEGEGGTEEGVRQRRR